MYVSVNNKFIFALFEMVRLLEDIVALNSLLQWEQSNASVNISIDTGFVCTCDGWSALYFSQGKQNKTKWV